MKDENYDEENYQEEADFRRKQMKEDAIIQEYEEEQLKKQKAEDKIIK